MELIFLFWIEENISLISPKNDDLFQIDWRDELAYRSGERTEDAWEHHSTQLRGEAV